MRVATTIVVLLLALPCGCVDERGLWTVAGKTQLSFRAPVDVSRAESSDLVVGWQVTSGSPDYWYVWGRARLESDQLQLRLESAPAAEALNSYACNRQVTSGCAARALGGPLAACMLGGRVRFVVPSA